ncbi:MAG: hypothetical protein JWO03_1057 [Bacteroidetes bacterium]|nr:hypothetical protein [Bacteroidota bacterium]
MLYLYTMKATITIESAQNKIDLLLAIAREMGISILNTGQYKMVTDELSQVSEPSLSEAWDSTEDERWDELYKPAE